MAELPMLPIWTDAYIADTTALSLEQHGAYYMLMMLAWRSPECRLPDDDKKLARMLGITPRRWAALRPAMEEFWTVANGVWTQKRLHKEFKKAQKIRESRCKAARAKHMKSNDSPPACADVLQAVCTDTRAETTLSKKEEATPLPPNQPPPRRSSTLKTSMARSREQFFKGNSLLNHKPKTNGSASKPFPESLGEVLGVNGAMARQNGPDYDDPAVRKARWRQKMHNWMIEALGLESEFVGELWQRYDACDMDAINGIEGFARDMRAEEQAIRQAANSTAQG